MIKLKKINDQIVEPVKKKDIDPKKILGYELFPSLTANIFLCSKKQSGKTNVIHHIVSECVNKKTTVIIFCPTIYKDDTWIAIIKYLRKKQIPMLLYTSIYDDDDSKFTNKKTNVLLSIVKDLLDECDVDLDNEDCKPIEKVKFGNEVTPSTKHKKPSIVSPDYLFIFDDISAELKDKSIPVLLKFHRHFNSKIIISSQWWNDLPKDARGQIDYLLIFRDIPDDKLDQMYLDTSINVDRPLFYQIYKYATKNKYQFLYVNVRNSEMRKNFNEEIIIE